MNSTREKSNSITHLVKIVAKEVFDEEFSKRMSHDSLVSVGQDFCAKIQSSLEKAGRPWTEAEDIILEQEIRTAIAQIAKNHERSCNAISMRLAARRLIHS